jgi:hypothetical protein
LLQSAFLPVQVWIEAKDNNLVTEPGIGKSEVVTLLPRPLGSALGERHRRLRAFRGKLVDFLAMELDGSEQNSAQKSQSHQRALEELRASLTGLKASDPDRTESIVLASDVLLAELSKHDAKSVADDLAAAVDEIAARAPDAESRAEELAALVAAAEAGASQLSDVGDLGLDLGSVAMADLGRIRRLLAAEQRERARAAAIHLAARLRRGTPSFGSKGGGVETGTPRPGGGQGTPSPSTAPRTTTK